MKTIRLNYLFLLLMLPAMMLAADGKGKYTKEKKISKAYAVNSNAALGIKNKYGNVYVTTWDESKTAIDVVISVSGNNEDKVTKRLNSIDVDFDATKDMVSAITKFGNFSGNVSMEINYTIKIPKNGSVNIKNEYGAIVLGKINGESYLVCKYGDLKIDALNHDKNLIDIEYCGSSKVGYINTVKAVAKYSELNITKAGTINLDAEYTNIQFNQVDEVSYKCNYGDINIQNGGQIFGSGNYTQTKIGTVSEALNITANYGDLTVGGLGNNVKNIGINTTYTTVRLKYPQSYPFDFEFQLNYGSLSGADDLNFQQKSEKSMSAYYKGYYKSPGKNKIYIKASYGDIKLSKS